MSFRCLLVASKQQRLPSNNLWWVYIVTSLTNNILSSLSCFFRFTFITRRWLYMIMSFLLARHKIYDFVSICINVCCLFNSTVKHQQISSFLFLLNQDLWFYCDKAKERRLCVDPHVCRAISFYTHKAFVAKINKSLFEHLYWQTDGRHCWEGVKLAPHFPSHFMITLKLLSLLTCLLSNPSFS